jgi:hypothetical protein
MRREEKSDNQILRDERWGKFVFVFLFLNYVREGPCFLSEEKGFVNKVFVRNGGEN